MSNHMNRRACLLTMTSAAGLIACRGTIANKRTPLRRDKHEAGRLEVYDQRFLNLVDANMPIHLLADGFIWTEGPAWDTLRKVLYFSDIPNNRIHSWDAQKGLQTFLDPAGRPGPYLDIHSSPGTNGILYLPEDDALLICNQDARSVDKLGLTTMNREPLARKYMGQRLNSPNDMVRHSNGIIFFTDPPYGLREGNESAGKTLNHNGVYRLSLDGSLDLISDEMTYPNGIGLSHHEKTLFVSQSDPAAPVMRAFNLEQKTNRIFHDFSDLVAPDSPGLPDGMAADKDGNIFVTGPGGVIVLAPDGTRLGRIYTGLATANCAFGEDGKTLFMTATDKLLSIQTKTVGST